MTDLSKPVQTACGYPARHEAADRIEALEAEVARLRKALAKDAVRFEVCAQYIAEGFTDTGTRRAERTMKAQHFALESLAALKGPTDAD